ncbi:MAG: hypothetical protein ACFBWO_13130 [Paracoccaceae bacterium]
MTATTIARAAVIVALAAGAASAQPYKDPDWPCEARKVRHLSWGQMWTGPVLPEESAAWREDETLSRLVAVMAPRRTGLDAIAPMLEEVQATEARSRDERLTALFAGVFASIDAERAEIVDGITRLARRERARAERIETMREDLARLEAEAGPEDFDALDRIDELRDTIDWETRIYDDRRRSLTYVCESPVILEKRVFAIARTIQGALGDG